MNCAYQLIRLEKCGKNCRKLRRLNGSIRTRNGLQQRSESSGARKESLCVPDYPTKQCEATTDEDVTLSDHENSERIDESAILKFEQEVDQLAAALAVTSKVVRYLNLVCFFFCFGDLLEFGFRKSDAMNINLCTNLGYWMKIIIERSAGIGEDTGCKQSTGGFPGQ